MIYQKVRKQFRRNGCFVQNLMVPKRQDLLPLLKFKIVLSSERVVTFMLFTTIPSFYFISFG